MARVDLNLDDIKDYVDEGWYLMIVRDAEVKEGPKGPYINWRLDISDPDIESSVPPVYYTTSFSVPSMVRGFLEACRFQWDADGSFHTEDVLGSELEAKLGLDEYEGKTKNIVEKVRPL